MLRRFLVLVSILAVALSMIGTSALRASADETPPTLSPTQGPAGTHVTASASDWSGCSSMSVSGWGQATLGTAAVSSSGAFTLPFTVPGNAPLGAAQLVFMPTCSHSTILTIATFTVTQGTPPPPSCSPSVSLTPSSGAVGSKFVMAGKGWLPGGTVTVTLPSTAPGFFESTTPFTPKVAADGTWQLTAIVGKPSSAGGYTFTFAESGCASKTSTFTVTAPPPPPAACSQVWFIGARGSGETASGSDGMGPGVDYMAKVLAAQLKADGGQSVHLMAVDYPADPVSDLVPDNAVLLLIAAREIPQALALYKETSVAEYDTSIESGMTVTLLDVASVLKRCSGARIILAGYSQGAIAVHDAENWIAAHAPSELRHIAGTLLLADGDQVANTKAREFGTSLSSTAKGLRVSLGLVKPHDVPLPQSTASIANKNDIVADFAFSHFATGISVHTHYAYKATVNGKSQMLYDPALGEAAHWVASRVLAGV